MSDHAVNSDKISASRRIRNLVLGEKAPDPMTMVVVVLNLFFGLIFLFWSALTYFIIVKKSIIIDVKSIQIDEIINKRGMELGFTEGDFLHRLTTLHAFGILIWLVFLFGVLLLYRQVRNFIFINASCVIFYLGMLIFYMNYSFFQKDITLFDKIGLIVIFTSSLIHYFLLRKEQIGNAMNFFHDEEPLE